MLFGSLGRLLICIVTVMISVSVVTAFHFASRGIGRSHNYFIIYYFKYLPFGSTFLFILMKTLAIAVPHLFCNQNTRTKLPCRRSLTSSMPHEERAELKECTDHFRMALQFTLNDVSEATPVR